MEFTKEQQDAAAAAYRAYRKEWRAKNKDKVKASNTRYWLKRAEQLAAERDATNMEDQKCE